MPSLWSGRLAIKYIFFEMLPAFILGVFVFLLIILMFESFRLIEHILFHGAQVEVVFQIVLYLSISFFPVILPMGLLFAVLLTYGRLNTDSEFVALKALGLNNFHFLFPAAVLGLLVCILSAHISFYLAPWGNRKMEVLLHRLKESKPDMIVKEGVFSEGFFDIVVYANKVDNKTGLLEKIFIYDEQKEDFPLTIIAKTGQLITGHGKSGNSAYLQLFEGSMHRASKKSYTKVDFGKNEMRFFDPALFTKKKKTPLSYTLNDLTTALKARRLPPKKLKRLSIEFHRRWALSIACLIFAVLGVGLGITPRYKSGKSTGLVLCLGVVVVYWILYASVENMARNGTLPVVLALWTPNFLFLTVACLLMRRST